MLTSQFNLSKLSGFHQNDDKANLDIETLNKTLHDIEITFLNSLPIELNIPSDLSINDNMRKCFYC